MGKMKRWGDGESGRGGEGESGKIINYELPFPFSLPQASPSLQPLAPSPLVNKTPKKVKSGGSHTKFLLLENASRLQSLNFLPPLNEQQ